jgi:hypothetical protein
MPTVPIVLVEEAFHEIGTSIPLRVRQTDCSFEFKQVNETSHGKYVSDFVVNSRDIYVVAFYLGCFHHTQE